MPKPLDTSHIKWTDYFVYDETSPTFLRWAIDVYNSKNILTHIRKGDVAGKKNGERSTVLLAGKRYKVHRIIWEMHNGPIPEGFVVDHLDGNYLNNSVGNLRAVPNAINTRNAAKRRDNISGVTGVSRGTNGRGTEYWVAVWCRTDGSRGHKRFNIKQLGEYVAYQSACEYRSKMLGELNQQGAGYTATHGVR